jgi:hypothetical protein
VKFSLLVSGEAGSPEKVTAFRRAIEDQTYILLGDRVGVTVQLLPRRCDYCGHAEHPELVCGFRPSPHDAACLCTAMDSPPKSARWPLTGLAPFWRRRPPYVVVFIWGALGWWFVAWNLLKR